MQGSERMRQEATGGEDVMLNYRSEYRRGITSIINIHPGEVLGVPEVGFREAPAGGRWVCSTDVTHM